MAANHTKRTRTTSSRTRRHHRSSRGNSKGNSKGKTTRTHLRKSKKWLTAIDAAQETLTKTGSLGKARQALHKQALFNARKMFGSVGKI